jgi:WD40 repeat protein
MGVVYQARHIKLNRPVALKMILAGSHAGAADLARFQTEAEAIARLRHPNIVQVYEVGEHDGKPFFSLEFCGGGSLEKKLGGTPLPPREAASLVETLARAMQAAHEQKVIHRDLKPANVLLAEDGTPKITDFGLAKKLDEAGQTASGAVMGTPSYMAPEQAGGKSSEIGPASDVYALGAILYECLTGRPPFRAATALDTIMQVVGDEPVPPSQLQPKTPRDLETICLKCLHKEADKRYASSTDLAADLRRWQDGVPIQARPVRAPERLWHWCRRNPALAALSGLAVAAMVLTVMMACLAAVKAREAASAAEEAARSDRESLRQSLAAQAQAERNAGNRWRSLEALGRAAQLHLGDDLRQEAIQTVASTGARLIHEAPMFHVNGLLFSPDAAWVAVSGQDWKENADGKGRSTHPVTEVREVATGRLVGRRFGCEAVAFRPGTSQLLIQPADKTIVEGGTRLWDFSAGSILEAPPGADGIFLRPDKNKIPGRTPAGMTVIASSDDRGRVLLRGKPEGKGAESLVLWDPVANRGLARFPEAFGLPKRLVVSPTGRYLAFSDDLDANTIHLWDWTVQRRVGRLAGKDSGGVALLDPRLMDSGGFSPGEELFAALGARGGQGLLRVWDVETGAQLLALSQARIFGWGAGDRVLVAAGPGSNPDETAEAGVDLRLFDDDRQVASFAPKAVQFWEIARPTPTYTLTDPVRSITLNEEESAVAVNNTLWKVVSDRNSTALRRTLVAPEGLFISPGAPDQARAIKSPREHSTELCRLVAFAPERHEWREWPLAHPGYAEVEARLRKGNPPDRWAEMKLVPRATEFAFSRDGKRALFAIQADWRKGGTGVTGTTFLELWDLAERKRLRVWECGGFTSGGMAISPDGRLAATDTARVVGDQVSYHGVRLVDLTSGEEKWDNEIRTGGSVTFSPDGRLVLAGRAGDHVELYEVEKGHRLRLWGDKQRAWCAFAVSPDGRTVASGGEDGLIRLWDVAGGEEPLARWQSHEGKVTALRYSRDGTTLFSGGQDGTLKLWNLPFIRKELAALGLDW